MGLLSAQNKKDFERDGYIVIDDLLSIHDVIAPVQDEYTTLLANWCRHWVNNGALAEDTVSLGFEAQLLRAYAAGLDYTQPLDISLPPGNILADTPFHAGPAIFELMINKQLLDAVEQLIGDELTSTPIQHVRIKPPEKMVDKDEVSSFLTSTNWHQDRATALPEADATTMVTAWVAMTDATIENGCLQVIPGSHRKALQQHCPLPQLGIPDSLMQSQLAKPLPVKSGGVIFFHPLTVHGSLGNESENVRWSFDLRYSVTGHASGRPMFPSFVARSAMNPDSEFKDATRWKQMWTETRDKLASSPAVQIHRWSSDANVCA